jgi:signal transduction histidine kinase/ActR/RegA family two-component response regulator
MLEMRNNANLDPVLVYAPIGRDARTSADLLERAGLPARICGDLTELIGQVGCGAAAVFIAEEGLIGKRAESLFDWVANQPPWSDLPFVLLTSSQQQPAIYEWRQRLVKQLRNVSLLERPIHAITLISALQTAVRARLRQYEVRSLLTARERTNQQLEALVAERTRELEQSNRELRTQIAERARAEETLRQAQKMEAIGQLTGGVAHDFNNLLMVISGGLEMLERQPDPLRRRRLIDGMRQAAQRGAGLTRQLLAFARRQELKPQVIDLERQLAGMRELLDRSLRGDVTVLINFANGIWPIEVDAGELELVVLNLALNARDAMPNGGTIAIEGENVPDGVIKDLAGEFVRLSVRDSGTGMTAEVKRQAIEPFFTTKEVGKGSGLGLAQAYGFAKQSGGNLRIDTELGTGTTITLFFPRSTKVLGPEKGVAPHLAVEQPPPGGVGRVLLVEDDDEVAALVGEMIAQLGYQVTRVASARAALGALANGRSIDIVFTDIMMPGGMNGVELAREIRARGHDVPILLTSAYAEAVELNDEYDAKLEVLHKPFQLEQLASKLNRAEVSRRECLSGG